MEKIHDESELMCPNCAKMVTAEQWDTFTLSMCKNRTLRRDFRSIVHMLNRPGKKKDFHFCCPYCEVWSRVNKIKLYDEEKAEKLLDKKNDLEVTDGGTYEEKAQKRVVEEKKIDNSGVHWGFDVEVEED